MNAARPPQSSTLRWHGLPKWLMLGVYLVAAGIFAGGLAANRETTEGGWMLIGAMPPALAIAWIVGFVWLFRAWAAVPPPMRAGASGKHVEPATAVALLFVPVYNVYWIFAANVGLARAARRWRASAGRPIGGATEMTALVACGVQSLVFYTFVVAIFIPKDGGTPIRIAQGVMLGGILLAPLAWFAFMFAIDRALAPLRPS